MNKEKDKKELAYKEYQTSFITELIKEAINTVIKDFNETLDRAIDEINKEKENDK